MGDAPSRCCRSDNCQRGAFDKKEEEEASGDETVWPDNTSDVGKKMPHLNMTHVKAPGDLGLSELAAEQVALEKACTVGPLDPEEARLPELPKSVSYTLGGLEQSYTLNADAAEEQEAKRRDKKADTLYKLRQAKSFETSRSDNDSPGDEVGEEGDNVNNLINNLISNTISRPSGPELQGSDGESYAKVLMRSNSGFRSFKHNQASLQRIVEHLFTQDEITGVVSTVSTYSSRSTVAQSIALGSVKYRKLARRIINNTTFTIFFMVLTFYAIFGPDLVILLLSREHDKPFWIANTVVFFLFLIELGLMLLGKHNYICTVTCLLDVVSVASLLSDTYFLQGSLMSDDGARVGRMARSSRMTRLARLVRVARVTRLLPRLMRLCGTQKNQLADKLLTRRLWRSFLYLDRRQENIISYLDFKCFYLAVLCNAEHMFSTPSEDMLKADVAVLSRGDDPKDSLSYLEFDDFKRTLLSTQLGKQMVQYHVNDVDRDEGVWTMTQKISDNIALHVCVCLLILIGVMDMFDQEVEDRGVVQGLEQLIEVAKGEPMLNGVVVDTAYLCEQIAIYVQRYSVLYLFLEGATYFRDGQCLKEGISKTSLNPFSHINAVVDQHDLRDSEYLQNCLPDNEMCDEAYVSSISLLSYRDEVLVQRTGDVLTTLIVIVLLLIFVYVLNDGITRFSKTLLQPLRALVDDMTAMSALELVNIDRDPPSEQKNKKTPKVVEELVHLQTACKSMRGAVKSWAKYVPPAVVERLYSSGVEAQIGVTRVNATILFCDIFEFEAACRGLEANEVLALLSQVLSKIADVINESNGTLLEFIGDEVLACFNTPAPQKEHKLAGTSTAIQIHKVIKELPPIHAADGSETQIRCRCGVHSGSILAGNLGSALRMKYGLLGDGINLTARLKGINSRYKTRTLASDHIITDPSVVESFIFRPVDLVAVKGKKEPTPVYEVLDSRFSKENEEEERWSKKLDDACQKHLTAFQLYRERHFADAQALLQEVQPVFDKADSSYSSQMLAMRCQRYIEDPPQADWDGVERLTKK